MFLLQFAYWAVQLRLVMDKDGSPPTRLVFLFKLNHSSLIHIHRRLLRWCPLAVPSLAFF
jgi:hypothetical protein